LRVPPPIEDIATIFPVFVAEDFATSMKNLSLECVSHIKNDTKKQMPVRARHTHMSGGYIRGT
jgi:hypothetical protein